MKENKDSKTMTITLLNKAISSVNEITPDRQCTQLEYYIWGEVLHMAHRINTASYRLKLLTDEINNKSKGE